MPPEEHKEGRETKEFDKRMDTFFAKVEDWKKMFEGWKESAEQRLEQAQAHPGMRYDGNIFRTPDGQIWEMGMIEVPKSKIMTPGYWPRGNEDAAVRELPKGAVRAKFDHSDDWAWELLEDYNAKFPAGMKPETRDDIAFAKSSLEEYEEATQFAEGLLNRREEIERWAEVRARSSVRQEKSVYHSDWEQLMEFLSIPASIYKRQREDTGMRLALAEGVDAISGQEVTRHVAY